MTSSKPITILFPSIVKEAAGSKVTVSVLLMVGLAYGAFKLGSDQTAAQTKQAEKVANIEVTLSRVTTILERMENTQTEQGRDLSAVESRTHQMNAELVSVSSTVEAISKKR